MRSIENNQASRPSQLAGAARVLRWAAALAAGWCVVAPCAAAERGAIFLIEDGSDAIHLSDRPTREAVKAARLIVGNASASRGVAPTRAAAVLADRFARQRDDLAEIVAAAARAQGLDPALLHAVIGAESGYARRAVSPRGAMGLMQLMPPTARDYGVTDPFDPRQNIGAGARHLRMLLDQFGQDTTLALAAYNAGAHAVWRHRQRVPPYAETLAYVPKVLGSYAALQRQLASPQP